MPIGVTCDTCAAKYRVRDEVAGKQMRCKSCGAVIRIPTEIEDDLEFLDEPADDDPPPMPASRPGKRSARPRDEEYAAEPPRARRPASRKNRSRSSSGGSGTGVAKIVGGVFSGLIALGFVIRIVMAVVNAAGAGAAWKTFSPPGAGFTVEMPGTPVRQTAQEKGVGHQVWNAGSFRFGCSVSWVPLDPNAALAVSTQPDLMYQTVAGAAQQAYPGSRMSPLSPVTVDGVTGREFTLTDGSKTSILRVFVNRGTLYATEAGHRGQTPPAEAARFHNSLHFSAPPGAAPPGGVAGPGGPAAGPPGAPTPPGAPAVAADTRPWLQRRAALQTRLIKRGKAPQQFENEPLPPNVTQATFPSGALQLKAWVSKPPGVTKAPALVFFHGGFAFGMDDLQACKPFMDAGYVVVAPATRGENGNPGDFELFFGEIDDAKAICKWAAQQPYIDPGRIYTFGHSVGGGISAVLSLMDDVPIRHGGSSGGLYDVSTFQQWRDITPFDTSNPEEARLRILVGNVASMQRPHYAYLGTSDIAFHAAELTAKGEAPGASKLTTERVPGDHFSSFEPALRRYLDVVRANP